MDYTDTQVFGALSFLVGIYGSGIYIISILRHRTRPHLFTWAVWGLLTLIGFLAQLHDGAGPGSWAMGMSTVCIFIIVIMSLRYGDKNFTRGDKIALAAALTAILPWLLTKDPLGSVILISLIDFVAFYPTFRKSWMKPHEENLTAYNLANAKFILALLAMDVYTLNTSLYLSVCMLANFTFIIFCLIRRRHMPT